MYLPLCLALLPALLIFMVKLIQEDCETMQFNFAYTNQEKKYESIKNKKTDDSTCNCDDIVISAF